MCDTDLTFAQLFFYVELFFSAKCMEFICWIRFASRKAHVTHALGVKYNYVYYIYIYIYIYGAYSIIVTFLQTFISLYIVLSHFQPSVWTSLLSENPSHIWEALLYSRHSGICWSAMNREDVSRDNADRFLGPQRLQVIFSGHIGWYVVSDTCSTDCVQGFCRFALCRGPHWPWTLRVPGTPK